MKTHMDKIVTISRNPFVDVDTTLEEQLAALSGQLLRFKDVLSGKRGATPAEVEHAQKYIGEALLQFERRVLRFDIDVNFKDPMPPQQVPLPYADEGETYSWVSYADTPGWNRSYPNEHPAFRVIRKLLETTGYEVKMRISKRSMKSATITFFQRSDVRNWDRYQDSLERKMNHWARGESAVPA